MLAPGATVQFSMFAPDSTIRRARSRYSFLIYLTSRARLQALGVVCQTRTSRRADRVSLYSGATYYSRTRYVRTNPCRVLIGNKVGAAAAVMHPDGGNLAGSPQLGGYPGSAEPPVFKAQTGRNLMASSREASCEGGKSYSADVRSESSRRVCVEGRLCASRRTVGRPLRLQAMVLQATKAAPSDVGYSDGPSSRDAGIRWSGSVSSRESRAQTGRVYIHELVR